MVAESPLSPADYWEDRYATSERVWSGRVNRVLADIADSLTAGRAPGRALDLGCGEGADAIWLATIGWDVTGVDLSATAVRRATEAARASGLDVSRVRFVAADLSDPLPATLPHDAYDLVTASFLHSTVELPRTDILRRAAALVAPGGHLLITSHAAAPPWAGAEHRAHAAQHPFLTPDEEIAELALDPEQWETVAAETRTREAVGPDGEPATLDDGVVLLRRR
ncbi:class I SAM-dependent methyltransferase [Agromyces protaetiae]|uniref:Class I SAM-dependent methyltransferase n=1 Tax=Agromyces protaetiae TaxID=2509455 RepID=A0A4V0YH42_9MICO|nr:class I SAM-dependent methyltransferase [Agromyces protaetiae]QAY73401.1 class I SAM-dependent methyltransferase [Agromyces protaetiae]